MVRHQWVRENLRKHVPKDASVVAQFDLFCQLPAREGMWPLALKNLPRGEYWVLDLKGFYGDVSGQTMQEILKLIKQLSSHNQLTQHFAKDGVLILQVSDPDVLKGLDALE